ncbi:class II fructose-bisphosphate aldolase [Buchnera aphidicola]|uniref:Fructose-bisphosphate aldolase n=1 Tax=Buchnera aphidicola (Anoecia oenotherae) TaxID=1241833 RepID=A0A4D6XRJ9_9GAMM|nr:class II fructose-bisphosphate aldolase [Buchnera aphidicola]QCI19466.1 class II fructose-bisphosphate aldolase [Buchnera aphidicola (Anoecia oenotherae)]
MSNILQVIQPGVIFGKDIKKLFNLAKKNNFAIPAINCINTDIINAVLESASIYKSPVIIQFSYGGSSFLSGKGIPNTIDTHKKSVIGSIAGANYVHLMAKYYNIPVILHTDHCHKNNLSWIDQLLIKNKEYFKAYNRPLFSSHMIDLSKETLEENIHTCKKYLKDMSSMNMYLEIELGCTGGEEDGIDNTNIDHNLLYTRPQDVNYAYKELKKISSLFTIAASFGNVHGVYKKGNVQLKPSILKNAQILIRSNNHSQKNPVNFVFHGGSGSSLKDITKSISYGVIKMNIDTDIQWKYWKGTLDYYRTNKEYLTSQLGNSTEKNKPNKKYYDPRSWIRNSQLYIRAKLKKIFQDLNSFNTL